MLDRRRWSRPARVGPLYPGIAIPGHLPHLMATKAATFTWSRAWAFKECPKRARAPKRIIQRHRHGEMDCMGCKSGRMGICYHGHRWDYSNPLVALIANFASATLGRVARPPSAIRPTAPCRERSRMRRQTGSTPPLVTTRSAMTSAAILPQSGEETAVDATRVRDVTRSRRLRDRFSREGLQVIMVDLYRSGTTARHVAEKFGVGVRRGRPQTALSSKCSS